MRVDDQPRISCSGRLCLERPENRQRSPAFSSPTGAVDGARIVGLRWPGRFPAGRKGRFATGLLGQSRRAKTIDPSTGRPQLAMSRKVATMVQASLAIADVVSWRHAGICMIPILHEARKPLSPSFTASHPSLRRGLDGIERLPFIPSGTSMARRASASAGRPPGRGCGGQVELRESDEVTPGQGRQDDAVTVTLGSKDTSPCRRRTRWGHWARWPPLIAMTMAAATCARTCRDGGATPHGLAFFLPAEWRHVEQVVSRHQRPSSLRASNMCGRRCRRREGKR